MVELYINEELIDLSVDQQIAITYHVNDIGDIKNQRANFSNQFKIPKTKDNCRKLGFVDQVTSADMRPYRALPARIIQDGEEIVRNGVCKILSADETINAVIYSGIKDFFETIGEAMLSDLDLSDLDHLWDEATITSLRSSEDGICYPLIDYGAGFQPQYQFFGIYVKTLFERIFAEAGFEYYGSFLNHPVYDKLIIPFANEKYLAPAEVANNSFIATDRVASNGISNSNYFRLGSVTINHPDGTWNYVPFNALFNINGNQNGLFDGAKFTVGANPIRGQLKLKGSGTTSQVETFWIRVVSNLKGVLWRFKSDPTGPATQRFSVEIPKSDYLPGEEVYIDLASIGSTVFFDLQFEFIANEEVVFGSTVDVARNMPDMKQRDFLKGIAHIFGLIYEQDENIQRVRIRQFDEIQTNKGAAIDWSEKLHVPASKKDSRTPHVSFDIGYAQKNLFKYKEDDTVAEGYGDGVLLVDNQNLAYEKTIIELPFAATKDDQIRQFQAKAEGDFVVNAEAFTNDTDYQKNMAATFEGSVFKWISDASSHDYAIPDIAPKILENANPMAEDDYYAGQAGITVDQVWQRLSIDALLQYEREFDTEPRIMVAELDGGIIVPYFIKPGGEYNLGFADSLLEKNYKTVADITKKTKFVKAYFNLSCNDVKNIDYLIPRYVSGLGGFFYINRIEKFMKGRTTVVHLVRV